MAACTGGHSPTTPTAGSSSAAASPAATGGASVGSPSATGTAGGSPSVSLGGSPSRTAGTPGAPSATTSPTRPAHPTPIWPTYHHDAARSGALPGGPAATGLRVVARARLDGAIYASPIVVRDAGGNLAIVATENNTLYGIRDDGRVAWARHVGPPVDGSTLPCGNIDPSGITGTPVYDPATGLVFAVAFLSGHHHVLVAVDAETGRLVWTRPADPAGSHPEVEQERGALTLAAGRVWVPYGGLYGDCGPYHGYLVGFPISGSGNPIVYQVPSAREAGIWAPPGAAYDGAGHLFVAVGNGAQTDPGGPYDMSDSVIELDTGGHVVSYYAPADWAAENAADLDLGTTGPLLLPGGRVFVAGKDGKAYLLRAGALGGVGGSVPTLSLCTAFGGAATDGTTVYVPCTSGLHAVRVVGSSLQAAWRAAPPGSPVLGGGVVFSADRSGTLYALDPSNGAVRWRVGVGDSLTRFATPALSSDGHLYLGTEHGQLVIVATA